MPSLDHPDASDLIELMIDQSKLTLWTNAQGEVISYNSLTQRADVRLVMNDGTKAKPIEIPVLRAVPVVWPKGGTLATGNEWSQTAPLEKGNPVMVWFLVHNIAEWLTDGVAGRLAKKRARFSLSSAVCYPGVSHKGNLIPTAATDPLAYVIRAALTIIKDLGTPEFVALANLVDARLAKTQSTFDGHGHDYIAPGGPSITSGPTLELSSSVAPNLIGILASVAATKLKAE